MNEYFGLIPVGYGARFLFYYTLLALTLFFIGKLVFKNNIKAGCWTTLILIIFFFWGATHDFIRSFQPPAILVSYSFLLPVAIVIIAVATYRLRKKTSTVYKLNSFLNLLFAALILVEAGDSLLKLLNKKHLKNNLTYYNKASLQPGLSIAGNEQKPDIFFIILDEYASSLALARYTGFDNKLIDSILTNKGFFIAPAAKSNYNSTSVSLASILDFQYFNFPLEGEKMAPLITLKSQYTFKKSLFPQLLTNQGYATVNLGLFDIEKNPSTARQSYQTTMTQILSLETLWGRIQREIWWNLEKRIAPNRRKNAAYLSMATTNIHHLKQVVHELNTQTATPKFVFAHITMPHEPYFFDSKGVLRYTGVADIPAFSDSLYIDQLIYTNTWIDSIATAASKSFARPRVVVLMGDHGYRDRKNEPTTRDKQFMNLNAFYFSDHEYTGLYDSISCVNTGRVVLNKYFNAQLPLIKDSTIRMIE